MIVFSDFDGYVIVSGSQSALAVVPPSHIVKSVAELLNTLY